jgi:hypothetical protein
MAVRLFTNGAAGLLAEIKKQIRAGSIETWTVDSEGDFTHTPHDGQWTNRAWLRPRLLNDRLLFNIVFAQGETEQQLVYSIYHGRFIEMAIRHVPNLFTVAAATPVMTKDDKALNE